MGGIQPALRGLGKTLGSEFDAVLSQPPKKLTLRYLIGGTQAELFSPDRARLVDAGFGQEAGLFEGRWERVRTQKGVYLRGREEASMMSAEAYENILRQNRGLRGDVSVLTVPYYLEQ